MLLIGYWFIIDWLLLEYWLLLIGLWFVIDRLLDWVLICYWFIIDWLLIDYWLIIDSFLQYWILIECWLINYWFLIGFLISDWLILWLYNYRYTSTCIFYFIYSQSMCVHCNSFVFNYLCVSRALVKINESMSKLWNLRRLYVFVFIQSLHLNY